MNLARWICLLGLLAAAPLAFGVPSIYTVTTTTGGTDPCTPNSTTDFACTLDTALLDAVDGDIIVFAPAIQGSTICCSFNVTKGLTIDGGSRGMILDGGGFGTVFYINSGNVVLSHLTIQHGLGGNSGGGVVNSGANLTLDSCTVANNTATGFGAGIDTGGGTTTTIINSTIADNTVTNLAAGGGIHATGDLVIANSTITGNVASGTGGSGYGGGIFATATLTLSSSIVAGNTATGGAPDIYGVGTQVSLGYNIVGNTSLFGFNASTGDQFDIDPLFMSTGLANNGGPTQTVALQSQSPARSGGNCAGNDGSNGYAVIPAVTLDQRGYARTSPGAIGCTVGAFDMTAVFHNGFE